MKKILLFILMILLSSGNASATCIVNPEEFWIDYNKNLFLTKDYINITCGFDNCTENATAEIRRQPNFLIRIPLDKTGSVFNGYSLLQSTMEEGSYDLIMYCGSESETRTININKLQLSLHSSSPSYDILYPKDIIKIIAYFGLNGNLITNRVSFDIYLGERLTVLEAIPNIPNNYWEIKARIPDDFDSFGVSDMRLNATYDGHTLTTMIYNYAEVKDLLSVDIINPSLLYPYRLTDTTDINITIKVSYRSMPLSPSSLLDFEAKLNSNDLTIRNIEYKDPSTWILSINIPQTKPSDDKYNLDIFVTYNGIRKKSRSLPIQFVLLFEGNVVDASNSAVGTEIRLKGTNIEERILTDSSGYYRAEILPGEYEVELILPDLRARLSNVLISSPEDLFSTVHNVIRYDFFQGDRTKTFFIEFNLPFDKIYIAIPYKDLDFNENEIVVYRCRNWNFFQRFCSSDWERISADIDNVKNLISLELNSLSAFSVSERNSLNLDIDLSKDNYAGDDATLTGRALDNKNNTVSNVKVDYSGVASGSVMSDSSGRFTIEFKAPDIEGEHHLTLEAKKDTYISVKKTVSFNIIKKKSMKITVPSSIDLDLGSASSMNIIIKNNGQADLKDIDIIIENIPPRWYKLSETKIDELRIGEDSVVAMNLSIDCSDCKEQYDVLVRAENEVVATNSFTINLNIPEKPPVTGFFIDLSSNQYLIIIVLILLAFLIYRKINIKIGTKNRSVLADLDDIKNKALMRKEETLSVKKDVEPVKKKEKKLKDILKNPFE